MHTHERTSRREFLRDAMAVAVVGATSARSRAEPQATAKKSKWPIACRDSILRHAGEPNMWSAMRAMGVNGAEVTVRPDGSLPHVGPKGTVHSIAGPDGVKRLGEEVHRHKRHIAAFCTLNRYDEHREQEVALTIKAARAAAKIGVPVVRIDLVPSKIKDTDEFVRFSIEVGKELVSATRDLPVRFGVENHGGTTNRPEFLRKVFNDIGTKRFGLTLDVGNFYWFGHPLSKCYDIYAEFAPWACHFHAKSIHYPEADRERQRTPGWKYRECRCPIYEGDIDYQRVAAILHRSNYRGALCIDDESIGTFPKPQRREVLKKDADFLRRIARPGRF